MINYRNIDISDKGWVDELLAYSDYRCQEYCFTSLFIWNDIYPCVIGRYKDFLIVRSDYDDIIHYFFPAGKGDIRDVIDTLIQEAESVNKKIQFNVLTTETKNILEECFPNQFEYVATPIYDDYIYDTQSLISLKGKKYQAKRNHIARFKEISNTKYENIAAHLDECVSMNEQWCRDNKDYADNSFLQEEKAVKKALKFFAQLKLQGALLRIDGRVIAFTIGEPLNSDTYLIHIEKAFSEINGAYPTINQSFLRDRASSYKYVDREDDAGDSGLRQAKLSYHPLFMTNKFCAIKK